MQCGGGGGWMDGRALCGSVWGKVRGNDLPHARHAWRHDAAAAMPVVTTLQLLTHAGVIWVDTCRQ